YFGKDSSGNPTPIAIGAAAAIASVALIAIAIIVASDVRARATVYAAAYQPQPVTVDPAKAHADVLTAVSALHTAGVLDPGEFEVIKSQINERLKAETK